MVITGIEETVRMLDQLPATVVANGYLRGLTAAGEVFENELHWSTPERDEGDRNEEKPHLRDSIVADVQIDSRLRGGRVQVGFGPMGYVAYFVEWGHRMVGHEPGKKEEGYVKAHPFMRAAFDRTADRAIEAFIGGMESGIKGKI